MESKKKGNLGDEGDLGDIEGEARDGHHQPISVVRCRMSFYLSSFVSFEKGW